MNSKVVEFPSGVDRVLQRLMAELQQQEEISEFQRGELSKRIPTALKPLLNTQVRVEVPDGLSGTPEALASVVQQVRDQFEQIFAECLLKSLKRHVQLIENLRKNGVTVEMRERDGL